MQTDTTRYTYTAADRLTTPDKTVITYARNTNGQISSIKVTPSGATAASIVVRAATWLPFGPISSYTLGNGQAVTRTYDANYRVTDIASPAFTLHLARDLMGNVSAIGPTAGANPATETYAYDPLYRLGSVTEASGTTLQSYTYNTTGDRLSKTAPGLATGTYLYNDGTHQLKSIGNAAQASDANGNTTGSVMGGGTYGFAYNARNRLSLAQLNGSTVGTYTYNALGQRIGKVTTAAERYGYNENSQLLAEYGATNRDYIWMDDVPVAVIDNASNGSVTTSSINYITADHLNTPRAVSDSAGTLIWSWAYQGNPFGEQQPISATGYVLNLRYPGQYYDAETGTNYNLFRIYGTATGRYLQSDPIGLNGGISTFAYVGNSPLLYVDPTGLAPNNRNWNILCFVYFLACNQNPDLLHRPPLDPPPGYEAPAEPPGNPLGGLKKPSIPKSPPETCPRSAPPEDPQSPGGPPANMPDPVPAPVPAVPFVPPVPPSVPAFIPMPPSMLLRWADPFLYSGQQSA